MDLNERSKRALEEAVLRQVEMALLWELYLLGSVGAQAFLCPAGSKQILKK